MSELALYRKYRSTSFDAVIGQPHIVETLKNAIAADRLSHAYLFTGPRGVGKTTVARLLARAANCTAEDPANRPCGECANCKVEMSGHLDLIEIDAASNRGIDDARALREKITSAPSLGRYKVYIIDEVHMLTTEAFNALLKTLEEPPAHALFILATTEAHKLPETIVSRTQRFSFRPIVQTNMIDHLRHIATSEKIEIDDGALALIAHASRGGFRDGIGLLDQAAASGAKPVTASVIRQLLGQSDPEILNAITKAVAGRQLAPALKGVDAALEQGVQAGQLATQLIDHWRVQLHELVATKSFGSAEARRLAESIETLLPILKSNWPELALEAALVRLTTEANTPVTAAPPGPSSAPAQPLIAQSSPPPKQSPPQVKEMESSAQPSTEQSTISQPSAAQARSVQSENPELWTKALSQIKQRNNSLYALLRSSVQVHFESDRLVLGCRFSFHRDRIKEAKNLQIIEQSMARVYGRKFVVVPQLEAKPIAAVAAPADSDNELVSSALEILGGEVIHES